MPEREAAWIAEVDGERDVANGMGWFGALCAQL